MSGTTRKTAAAKRAAAKPASDEVSITLAHPISRPEDKRYLGLSEEEDFGPGDKITVNRNAATSLIASGLAVLGEDADDEVEEIAEGLGVVAPVDPAVEPSGATK